MYIETCILPYVKQVTSASSVHEAGHSKLLHGDDQGDGMGRELRGGCGMRGTHVHPWLIHVDV